ncbi:MAG: SigB/SigF/SigG family RNA polymerase sigma factor [Eubacterium ventriosum]|uniref:SigB/SigF/SigG family RNA polymerase sigma factor n=1 Tax=Eubacterium ventriosum TaxID=39496 RepID=UPI001DD88899|nr:SigB/SigF/SigG family RNA polymerase sigma factor [Eubacterium ventriosum]MBD9054931.1 SigB/SigF/SigG family RNA polymerase sigma factor [Eubacterium ventriosum]
MDTLTLINRAHQGDKLARDKILIENTGLIWSIVRRFLNRGHEGEDLFQIGCIGMLKAIDRFDTEFDVAFSTYAVPMIAGEIRRFIRDDGIVKISRKIKENQMKIMHQREIYINEKKQEPTIEELEKVCDLTKEEIVMAMDASRNVESIDKEMYSKDSAYTLMDLAEDDTNIEETVLNKIMVQQLMDMLESKERRIINLRYFKNKTQSQVAKEMGMTQVQVSRLEKKILNSMRNEKST